MNARLTLELPAQLAERHEAEKKIRALCQLRSHPDGFCDGLISAFIEAFNNVVIHAYKGRKDGVVEVLLEADEERVVIEVADRGQSFDLTKIPHAPPEGLAEGGYGLHIIRSLMSEVSYFQDGDRNVLRMVKRLPETTTTPVS